jgi:hypothetical protein
VKGRCGGVLRVVRSGNGSEHGVGLAGSRTVS